MKKAKEITEVLEVQTVQSKQTTDVTTMAEASYTLVLPKRTPIRDTGFRLPEIVVPSRMTIGQKDSTGALRPLPKGADGRELVPVSIGNNRFVVWNDVLQGNIIAEQERCDKNGLGIQVYVVMGENFKVDANLEWICSRNGGLKVNA
jgi:hypothetical protein